ncbi:AAA family ATPase [Agromyces archimandritae]|uniref:AAA family ATPase n=1 Tax=Agromyces archimandritae TaxID=2781962 RepID=A0A975FKJ8_9MICO|nr:ATP-binding protein [Agromyces archimandritae]QTX04230.1 AAA family ATPase [Agromyces archimandritae]
MDAEQQRFIETFRLFLDEVARSARPSRRTPLGELVAEHLGADPEQLPVVAEAVASHRYADVDVALEELAEGGRVVGVTGGQMRQHEPFPALLRHEHVAFGVGPVDYTELTVGPGQRRQAIGMGVRLFAHDGAPIAVLQREAAPQYGRESAAVEVVAGDPGIAASFLTALRERMLERSVLRGKVVSFEGSAFGHQGLGVVFHERPTVPADDVVLPEGTMEAVTAQALDITRLAPRLTAAGRHLKRGILLYGPPGTGKTLTVRHLIGRAEGVTTVLLTGAGIANIREAAELARTMQPALVVLEDVDLVAMDRGMAAGPQPLLFAVLDALDGLDGDADVAFVLTTNRVEVLEPALAERPGRVDLAVEIPLPARDERRRLFDRYARGTAFSADAVRAAADRAEGTTGSFAKELMRRATLTAAQEERDAVDADLEAALDELLDAEAALGRRLLGGTGGEPGQAGSADPGSSAPGAFVGRRQGYRSIMPG